MIVLERYLHKRAGLPNWQLRWPLPPEVRNITGTKEWTKSLKTSDRRLAEKMAIDLLSDWQCKAAGITAGRSGDEPVALDIYEDAHQRFFVNAELNFERKREKHGLASLDANLSALSPKPDYASRSYILDDHTHMMPTFIKMVSDHGIEYDPTNAEHQGWLRFSAEQLRAAIDRETRRLEGNPYAEIRSDAVRSIQAAIASKAAPKPEAQVDPSGLTGTKDSVFGFPLDWRRTGLGGCAMVSLSPCPKPTASD